jgi:hypothetical protein
VPRNSAGATVGLYQSATNFIMNNTMDFNATTNSFAHFSLAFPKAWDRGTITFQPHWMPDSADTITNSFFCTFSAQAISDGDTIDTAMPAAVSVTDTMNSVGTLHVGPESAAVTVSGGPLVGDLVYCQVGRDVTDTLIKTVYFIGLRIFYNTNAINDV